MSRRMVVSALLAELNRRETQQMAALQKKYAPKLVPDREYVEFARRIEAERTRELKSALGEDGYQEWDKAETLRDLNRARPPGDELPMTATEAEQAYRLQKEFAEKSRELQMAMEDGVADRADVSALQAQAQRTLDRELEQLLGTQRFNELRGNVDPTVDVYRALGDLNPTPEQAKAVLRIDEAYRAQETAFAKELSETPRDIAKIAADLKTMNDAKEEQLRTILGADAYDKNKRQNDPSYKALKQYAEAWELKEDEVSSVYGTLRAFNDQTERLRGAAELSQAAGQRVNWREIDSTVDRARQATEARLQDLIGPERLRRLKQNELLTPR